MRKVISWVSGALMLASMASSSSAWAFGGARPSPTPTPSSTPTTEVPSTSPLTLPVLSPVTPGAAPGPLRVNLAKLDGFSSAELTKVRNAAELVEVVVNSEEFRQAVLNFTWNGQKQFANNNGLTNEQVYQTIMLGREQLTQVADSTMDLYLNIYNAGLFGGSTVGYGYPDSMDIFMNRKFFLSFTLAEVAGNIIHEWTHKLGFEHDFKSTPQRPYSVPYAIGNILIDVANRGA